MTRLTIIALAVGAIIVALITYNLAENAKIRAETRSIVEAEALKATTETINEISNTAERARAMRRTCTANGMQYNFETGKCK